MVGEATASRTEATFGLRTLAAAKWRKYGTSSKAGAAATITHISPDIQVQFKKFEILDRSAWENIRSGLSVSKAWFFQLNFRKQGLTWSYTFFAGRHYWGGILTTTWTNQEARVCLLIGEQIGGQNSVRLDQSSDIAVTLKRGVCRQKKPSCEGVLL